MIASTKNVFKALAALVLFLPIAIPLLAQTNVQTATKTAVWTVPPAVRDFQRIKQQQFVIFNPQYVEEKSNLVSRFHPVAKQLFVKEAAGEKVQCAHEIFEELWWLLSSSAGFKRMNERLHDLETNLASQNSNDVQEVAGLECVTEWWERLEWAYDHINSDEPIPQELLERFNSPEKLTDLLMPLSVSDIARTGSDNRWEFNVVCADLIRWIIRDRPGDKGFHPELKETCLNLVFRLQDPETGFWGQRYILNGKEQFVPDLSTTFHIVSYLKGEVPHFDKIIETTLAVRDLDAPLGWFYNGQVWNHNFTDVVYLFKWGWPRASEEQKKAMAAGIQDMLHRCLTESLQTNGSFKILEVDVSIEEATYFGMEFLSRIGFFDKSKRFWTDQDFPEADGIRKQIVSFIEHQAGGAAGGSWYNDALKSLNSGKKSDAEKGD